MGTCGGWMAGHSVETALAPLLSFGELRHALRQIGEQRYHHRHPFHLLMHDGKLSRGQLQAWALNRYYYQSVIPIKDAIIIPAAKILCSGAHGERESSIMMEMRPVKAGSSVGSNWRRPLAWILLASPVRGRFCQPLAMR